MPQRGFAAFNQAFQDDRVGRAGQLWDEVAAVRDCLAVLEALHQAFPVSCEKDKRDVLGYVMNLS